MIYTIVFGYGGINLALEFKTKAQTLLELEKVDGINILPVYIISSDEFNFSENTIENIELLNNIIDSLGVDGQYIVRSSCKNEDQVYGSNAGKYTSVLNVEPTCEKLFEAVCEVYFSYGSSEKEEILVQPMLSNVVKSGVIFTRDLYTAAPYYCVNYWEGNDTSAITAGSSIGSITEFIFRDNYTVVEDEDLAKLLECVRKIEGLFDNDYLDIEFGITLSHEIYIFQVRPVSNPDETSFNGDIKDISNALLSIKKKVEKLMRPRPFISGKTSYFGVMPDWNPAEIIGLKPKKLAISLYKELITDSIWACQRENYGYKSVKGNPLMVIFCGIPYIDTRVTFNSFIPSNLSNELTEKLVNYYLEKLKEDPSNHDKIEFNIVFSCYYLGIKKDITLLKEYGFTENECWLLVQELKNITNLIINPITGYYKKDLEKIEKLNKDYYKIINSDISTIDRIYWLIETCKENGTLPFAGIARTAFIAVQILKSLVNSSIMSIDEYNSFMAGLNTISKQMTKDRNELSKNDFLLKYGHIRPGTYDIESPRYDDAYDLYFGNLNNNDLKIQKKNIEMDDFVINKKTLEDINLVFEEDGINITAEDFFEFAKKSIEGREYAKFVFTKVVSEVIRQIEVYGRRLGISKSDLAHLDIQQVTDLYSNLYEGEVKQMFERNISENKYQYNVTQKIKPPILIFNPNDIYYYKNMKEEPNYITTKSVIADVVKEEDINMVDVSHKIILIRAADPGYDYLFTKEIAGLITQFGGANSHMAIRCAELQIPAVIGVGEKNYIGWSKAKKILIDAHNRNVKVIEYT